MSTLAQELLLTPVLDDLISRRVVKFLTVGLFLVFLLNFVVQEALFVAVWVRAGSRVVLLLLLLNSSFRWFCLDVGSSKIRRYTHTLIANSWQKRWCPAFEPCGTFKDPAPGAVDGLATKCQCTCQHFCSWLPCQRSEEAPPGTSLSPSVEERPIPATDSSCWLAPAVKNPIVCLLFGFRAVH